MSCQNAISPKFEYVRLWKNWHGFKSAAIEKLQEGDIRYLRCHDCLTFDICLSAGKLIKLEIFNNQVLVKPAKLRQRICDEEMHRFFIILAVAR